MMGLDDGRGIVISLFDSSSLVVAVYVAAFFLNLFCGGLVVGIFFARFSSCILYTLLYTPTLPADPASSAVSTDFGGESGQSTKLT